MKIFAIALFVTLISFVSHSLGQTVLYYHPSSGSNSSINTMISDMTTNGATVTTMCYEEGFEKCLHSSIANSEPFDLVLVSDETVDAYNDDVWDYLTSGNSIFILTSE